jgi:glycosyltransferase involved in cell wall biosynthesis
MKALIIGKVWPEPNSSAAGRRMKQLIQLLQKRGEVHFACATAFTGNEMDLVQSGVKVEHIELNDDSVNAYFQTLNPAIVVFDRFLTEEQYGWRIIEQCPDAVRILNTEDLHFLRKTRQQFVKKYNRIPSHLDELDFHNDETMRELASVYRSDWTLLISPFEKELLEQEMQIPSDLLSYLPLFSEQSHPRQALFSDRHDFLFIGNILHEPNLDAIRVLTQTMWPQIREQLPKARLLIAGAYPTQEVMQLHSEQKGVIVLGHIQDVDTAYQTVRVSLMPLRFGAGIKGKILESMEHGIPFVTTSIGAEGMFLEQGWDDCIADNPKVFIQKAVDLYTDETKWNRIQESGVQHLTNHFDRTQSEALFSQQLDVLIETIHEKRKKRYFSRVVQHHTLMSTRYLSKWIMEKNKH